MYFQLGVKESRKDFFNFEGELEGLVRELKKPETRMIVVKGIRRTGKSSLLRVGLAESRLPHLLLDARAFGPFSPDQLYDMVANSLSKLAARYRALENLLQSVKGMSVSGVTVNFTAKSRLTFLGTLEKLSRWGESTGKPVVLALDEAQEFMLFPKFDSLLAYVYDSFNGVKLVLSGSEVGVLDLMLGRTKAKAPLFGRPYFEIEMGRLPKHKAEEFLKAGFEQMGRTAVTENILEAVDRFDGIIGWLTNYGYYATRLGHKEAVKKTLEEGARLIKEELDYFLAQRRQARSRYLGILRMIATPLAWSEVKRGLSVRLGVTVSDKQLSRYLSELVDYGFAVKTDNRYVLADPLIAHALIGAR